MLSIKEQYQHPHWHRKELDILRRDRWKCTCCGETNKLLHVYAIYYETDLHIWGYDDEALKTVCDDCMKILKTEMNKLSGIIAFKILSGEIDATDYCIKNKVAKMKIPQEI